MRDELDSACIYGGGDCGGFSQFYKQTIDYEAEDSPNIDNYGLSRPDFPRLLHNNIETFQYYSADKFNNCFVNNDSQISTLNVNVRGINCNYDNFVMYLNSLKYNFDALILTECHIQADELYNADLHNMHPIDGYDKFYVKSSIKFGGVVMYVKSEGVYCHELTKTCATHDSVYVKIDPSNLHKTNSKTRKRLFIGGYYRHCNTGDIMNFIDEFSTDLAHKSITKNDVILGGDFNICLMKSTYNNDSLCFLNTILSNLYEILIFKPTRIQFYKDSLQVKSATIIDQIMTNLFAYECTSGNLFYPGYKYTTVLSNHTSTTAH